VRPGRADGQQTRGVSRKILAPFPLKNFPAFLFSCFPVLRRAEVHAKLFGDLFECQLRIVHSVISREVLSARSDLGAAANENIRSWKFEMPRDLYRTEWKYEMTFGYHSREVAESEPGKLTVVFESFHRVDVTRDFHKISDRIVGRPFQK
jgi:hypothetical protein